MSHSGEAFAMRCNCVDSPSSQADKGFVRGFIGDHQLHAVLAVWALCWFFQWLCLNRYCSPLPWCDEWELTPVATGQAPIDLSWLWTPQNEHRAPLTRLEVVLLGWLDGWELRLAHHINLAVVALGVLSLLFAVRSVRGHSAVSDTFLCLLVLTPWQFRTLFEYVYAYAMALGFLCLAISALVTGWPLRSSFAAGIYFALVLVVALSGGPAGNVWAIGLCAVLLRGWLVKKSRLWLAVSLSGTVLVLIVSIIMLVAIPRVAVHAQFRSNSWTETLVASGKASLAWMGAALEVVWPWALFAVAIPLSWVFVQASKDIWKTVRGVPPVETNCKNWVELAILFLATLSVAGMIGYGRGKYPHPWDSRYATLTVPIGIVLYLLSVRLRGPVIMSGGLAVLMAVCVGWSWPTVIAVAKKRHAGGREMVKAIRSGDEPLSVLARMYAQDVGYQCNPDKLLTCLLDLRDAKLSLFQPKHQRGRIPDMGPPLAWEARNGKVDGQLNLVTDPRATRGQALEAASTQRSPGTATYEIDVPASGSYDLYCRVFVPGPYHFLTVQADDGPVCRRDLDPRPDYYPVDKPISLDLHAGKHELKIRLGKAGTRMDLLELIPRKRKSDASI
jgi:hypothetical protein